MKCNCEKNCIEEKNKILDIINKKYTPCDECNKKTFKKAMPLKKQIKLEKININYARCPTCNKRHIDVVMAHILKIMIENNQLEKTASIRKVGTPLITPAIPLEKPPYLPKKSLVIITEHVDKNTAEEIYAQVPEVKGVIRGNSEIIIGIKDENTKPHKYELLVGCSIRCDIQQTDIQPIIIYKDQSRLHIEYAKKDSEKIENIKKILNKHENPRIIDAMCGPGTLGIYALKNNASYVLFNDINEDATDATKQNLKINEIKENYKIMNENILDLEKIIDSKFDIGFIDAFPEIEVDKYVDSLKKICDEVIII